MTNNLVFARGWLDTRERIAEVLKADEFLSRLITRNAIIPIIKGESVGHISAATQILCGARYLAHEKPARSQDYVKALVIGELMAPVLPRNLSLPTIEATREFDLVCLYLLEHETMYNRGKGAMVWIGEIIAGNVGAPAEDQLPVPDPVNYTRDDYQNYLLWLAYSMPKPQYLNALQLVVTSYVGVAKRGNVSERFIEKIIVGIKADLGEDITIDPEVINTAYNCFGRYVTAENARVIFEGWLADIPEHALRLRLTLQQVSGSGLTAFLITGRAIKRFSDFPWARLEKLTGGELTAYMEAVREVGGNAYYGFNRDLGPAKSTNFSSVAYVAKELLLQLSGETTLKNYQGWIKKPKAALVVKKLIDDYITNYNEGLLQETVSDADRTIRLTILEMVSSEDNIRLFS